MRKIYTIFALILTLLLTPSITYAQYRPSNLVKFSTPVIKPASIRESNLTYNFMLDITQPVLIRLAAPVDPIVTPIVSVYDEDNNIESISYSVQNDTITIRPTTVWRYEQTYSVFISNIKQNDFSPLATIIYRFRTLTYTPVIVGYSHQNRGIAMYRIGNGEKVILLFGAIHGDESNTTRLLTKMIIDLEVNSANLPSDITVYVIPNLNPDGSKFNRRLNARGVDLNRNFDTSDWRKDTYIGWTKILGGGGTAPFSEKETRAIRDVVQSMNPQITVSYHSAGSYVIANSPYSTQISNRYSNIVKYQYRSPTQNAFSYPITGDFNVWMQKVGKDSITVELSTKSGDDYPRNRPAIWDMINYVSTE